MWLESGTRNPALENVWCRAGPGLACGIDPTYVGRYSDHGGGSPGDGGKGVMAVDGGGGGWLVWMGWRGLVG